MFGAQSLHVRMNSCAEMSDQRGVADRATENENRGV